MPDIPADLHHWIRRTVAEPDGGLTHDGDCHWFGTGICTCGFFHALGRHPDTEWELPFAEQAAQHRLLIDHVRALMRGRLNRG